MSGKALKVGEEGHLKYTRKNEGEAKVVLKEYAAEMERCSQCSYCRWIPLDQIKSWRFAKGCPSVAYSDFQSYSARGRYVVARSLWKGEIGYSERVLDIVFKCVTCGNCDVSCKICRYNLEPLEMIRELRAKLVEDGQSPAQHLNAIKGLRMLGNMLLKPRDERGNWADELDIGNSSGRKMAVVFHAGCKFSYDKELQKVARLAVTLLSDSGVKIGIMGEEENCCGLRAYDMGYREEFAKCAEINAEKWNDAGVKTIITSCADCYYAFKRLYPKLGFQFEVIHFVEYLDKLIQRGKIKFTRKVPLKVTYHDPCHLGRQGEPYVPWRGREKKINKQIIVYEPRRPRYNGAWGIYNPPRNVLKSIPGIELVEMERIREYSWCCGAGGGAKEAFPDFSRWTANERIEEAKSTGAEAIVSACGWCESNFLESIAIYNEKIKVYDIVELVSQAI